MLGRGEFPEPHLLPPEEGHDCQGDARHQQHEASNQPSLDAAQPNDAIEQAARWLESCRSGIGLGENAEKDCLISGGGKESAIDEGAHIENYIPYPHLPDYQKDGQSEAD